ncbi:hypothetical protein DSL72_007832 [Monilinia vaccinii-corymbosi]|uniref:Uncharacterized protein n=1 Tax=Monilinia vaccinii-corymbosi TaxID=61207 RepID=A0A8A3PIR7_9HELO|nr:hypothetical protein DSL72_007832 [Monilinia vaccinii-corymbosi]
MTSLVTSTDKKKGRIRGFSIHEDIRRPLSLLSQNISRSKTSSSSSNEGSISHITDESKKAISILINKHERTKSELEDRNSSEEKARAEMRELRAQVRELQDSIQKDQEALERLNSQVEIGIQEFSAIPDTQEALLESLIRKEAEIDRELFYLRDDKVIARGELWFGIMGRVDESLEHPDQASRDRNLLMRKEMFLRSKRSIAQDTKAKLLLAKEDIQKQKLEILQENHVEGHQPLREASPISEDSEEEDSIIPDSQSRSRQCYRIPEESDQDSIVARSQLEEGEDHSSDGSVETDQQYQDSSWLTEESPSKQSFRFKGDDHWAEESHLEVLEEIQSVNVQLQTAYEELRRSEDRYDRFRTRTRSTIKRISSEVTSAEKTISEYKISLDEAENVRRRLLHNMAKLQGEKACLLVMAQEVALPILASTAEHIKRVTRDGVPISLNNSHLPPNKGIIRSGNSAASGGHINSHFASIVLAENEVVSSDLLISGEMFLAMYGVSVGEYKHFYNFSKSLDRLFNMHAILVELGCFTDLSLSKTQDSLVQNLFAQCLLEFEAIDAPTPEEKGRIFDAAVRAKQVEKFNEIIELKRDIKRLYKEATI